MFSNKSERKMNKERRASQPAIPVNGLLNEDGRIHHKSKRKNAPLFLKRFLSHQRKILKKYSQEPVDCDDHGDVLGGEVEGGEHQQHGDQTGGGHRGGADGGRRGGQRDDDNLPQVELHCVHLRNEDGGHRLVQRRPVHVHGGTYGQHKSGYLMKKREKKEKGLIRTS